jgi:acyl transferase domain-containing protein
MVAVRAPDACVREALRGRDRAVALAAVNGPESVVISGGQEAVEQVARDLAGCGIRTTPLAVSHAFHSPLVEPMLAPLADLAAGIRHGAPRAGLVSNLTGRLLLPGEVHAAYWVRHAREAVQFRAGMATLEAEGCRVFVEIGPAPVLLGLGRQCLPAGAGLWLPTLRRGRSDWAELLHTLGELYVHGVPVDWAAFDRDYPRRKLSLPTYPFERQRYWLDAEPEAADAPVAAPAVAPAPCGLLARLAEAAPSERREILVELVSGQAARCLRLDPGQIDPRRRLMDLGFDSLIAVEFRSALGKALGLEKALPATLVFDYPTVEAVALYLEREVLGASAAAPPGNGEGWGRLGNLEQLSEEDAEALLLERLQRR